MPEEFDKDLTKMEFIQRRAGMKFIHFFPEDEPVVAMITHGGRVLVATSRRIWELVNIEGEEYFRPIKIERT